MTNFIIEIKSIFGNIVNYLTNSWFYEYLSKLFKETKPSSKFNTSRSIIKKSKWKITNNERKTSESIGQSNRNSKISKWFKPQKDDTKIKKEK